MRRGKRQGILIWGAPCAGLLFNFIVLFYYNYLKTEVLDKKDYHRIGSSPDMDSKTTIHKNSSKEEKMKKSFFLIFLIAMISVVFLSVVQAASTISESVVPLPPALQNLPKIPVAPWLQVEKGEAFLEGPAFDRGGNLFVSSVFDSRIIKITPPKKGVRHTQARWSFAGWNCHS